ncbi:MAG TPA: hypothetical protein VGK74_07580 [Symbiobacteriaceae bacterium]|jgi:hypothetical protein
MRWFRILAMVWLSLALFGCGYEDEVTRVETPGGIVTTPDPGRYGQLRLVWVREFHKPRGFGQFPDGGKARETAFYAVVYQSDGRGDKEVGQISLSPVRKGDFGNLNAFKSEWQGSGQLHYRVEYGYSGSLAKVKEGDLTIPPLSKSQ